jgi:hypothetical protein
MCSPMTRFSPAQRSHRLIFAALLLILTCLASVSGAIARTWYIKPDGTGDAPTIQAGVDAASAGDIVLVAAGTYTSTSSVIVDGTPTTVCVAIGKDVKLISESGPAATTIKSESAAIAIFVHDVGPGAEINGFKIQTVFEPYGCTTSATRNQARAPLPSFLRRGIRCNNAAPLITNNEITMNGAGIELLGASATVSGNNINYAFFGIACLDGSNVTIANNIIHTCATMVWGESSALTVTDNELFDGCTAVGCDQGSLTVLANSIHDVAPVGVDCGGASITLENNLVSNTNLAARLNGLVGTCVITGNVLFNQYSGALSLSDDNNATITIEANTIDLTTGGAAIFCQAGSSPAIRRNIIVRSISGIRCEISSFPFIECNDIVASQGRYVGGCSDQTGLNGNISADPQFCGLPGSGNYALQVDSPCAPGNHPNGSSCGRIGARDAACGAVATKAATWGAIKALYRR